MDKSNKNYECEEWLDSPLFQLAFRKLYKEKKVGRPLSELWEFLLIVDTMTEIIHRAGKKKGLHKKLNIFLEKWKEMKNE